MTYIKSAFQEFLVTIEGFDQLPSEELTQILDNLQPFRYRIGQKIIGKERTPERVTIIYEGQVRLLGFDPQTQVPTTLKLMKPGEIIGEIGLLRDVACETAIASADEVIGLTLNATDYLRLLESYPGFAHARQNQSYIIEVFDVLSSQLANQANVISNLDELAAQALENAKIDYLPPGRNFFHQLDSESIWFVSGGTVTNYPIGSRLEPSDGNRVIEVQGESPARLVGLEPLDLLFLENDYRPGGELTVHDSSPNITEALDIPYASEEELPQSSSVPSNAKPRQKFPFVRGKGELNSTFACFQMLTKHLQIPFRKEVVRRILNEQIKRQGTISFPACAYLSELIGLKANLVDLPAAAITRVPTPALVRYGDGYAVLYAADNNNVVLGVPSQGIVRCKPAQILEHLDIVEDSYPPQIRVLLLSATKETPQERFGLRWFIPYLSRYRRVCFFLCSVSGFSQSPSYSAHH